jgi:RES domain-containing protein
VLVNAGTLEELQQVRLMEIEIPETVPTEAITPRRLKKDWQFDFEYTQWLGSEILTNRNVCLVKCPSAVVDREHNFIINPLHKDFKKVKLVTSTSFYFDERLFKTS